MPTTMNASPSPNPKSTLIKRIAFIGNYLPAKCGIATFTTDLTEALASKYTDTTFIAIPSNDGTVEEDYPQRVRFVLEKEDIESYKQAAYFLNMNSVELVCLQHEFGIYGGDSGHHILTLLNQLNIPVVTTFHTVLKNPKKNQAAIFKEIANLSDRLVIMTRRAREFLEEIYDIPRHKIDLIPHGIPNLPFTDPNFYKDQFGVEGRTMLLTFGLISRNKGLEYVIEALPAIVEQYPNVVYVILGTTHPAVLRHEGESYREHLLDLVKEKGVEDHVIFQNRFVSLTTLLEYIGAADIYVTPYLNEEQIVSGTLAYAVGAGKPVVSTPYWHAEELLAENRGILVPFRDSEAIAEHIIDLLDNDVKRHGIRKHAYLKSREAVWSAVAKQYMTSFTHAKETRFEHPQPPNIALKRKRAIVSRPTLKLDHLIRMTDSVGLFQHAIFSMPRYSDGYCTDDNARALIAMILMEKDQEVFPEAKEMARRYMAFLWHAFDPQTRRFRNFMTHERTWGEKFGSEDSHGRTIWALGTVLGRSQSKALQGVAYKLIEKALPVTKTFTSPRAMAFIVQGMHEYLKSFPGDRRAANLRKILAFKIAGLFEHYAREDWHWFEDIMAYSNGQLPLSMLLSGPSMGDDKITQIGLDTLEWLVSVQKPENGHLVPVGSNGFYRRGGTRARFDQQPIEAYSTVAACVEAFHLTGDESWREDAEKAFEWFLGRNDLRLPLYNPRTGGCHDGLEPNGVNQNEGAESTLAFILSLLNIQTLEEEQTAVEGLATRELDLPAQTVANASK